MGMILMTTCRISRIWPYALIVLALSLGCVKANAQTRSDPHLMTALREMYSEDEGDARYFLKWFDLNGDGTPEAIVHVVGPHVCGTGGCDTHIFARHGSGYRLVSTIGLSRPLVIASPRRAHGWRNLIVFVAGGGILPGYYAELRFDGRAYPDNPTVKPAKRVGSKPRGEILIKEYQVYTEGEPPILRRGNLTTACTRPPTRTLSCSDNRSGRRVMPGVRFCFRH